MPKHCTILVFLLCLLERFSRFLSLVACTLRDFINLRAFLIRYSWKHTKIRGCFYYRRHWAVIVPYASFFLSFAPSACLRHMLLSLFLEMQVLLSTLCFQIFSFSVFCNVLVSCEWTSQYRLLFGLLLNSFFFHLNQYRLLENVESNSLLCWISSWRRAILLSSTLHATQNCQQFLS